MHTKERPNRTRFRCRSTYRFMNGMTRLARLPAGPGLATLVLVLLVYIGVFVPERQRLTELDSPPLTRVLRQFPSQGKLLEGSRRPRLVWSLEAPGKHCIRLGPQVADQVSLWAPDQ